MPRSTWSEFTICGIAFGDTKAPTSTVCSPAPTRAPMKAMRSATLTGVFSFCRPSRGPTSTMRTKSLMLISRSCRFDFGEFDAFLHDIADLAFYRLQHAGEWRAQGLLHLHHFKRENGCALLQPRAHFRQQGHDGTRQRRHDLVFADLLFVVAAERIDPVQVETAVAGSQIQFMTFDHGYDVAFHAVHCEIEPAIVPGRRCKGKFALADRQRRRTVAVVQADLLRRVGRMPERKHPLPPADWHPAGRAPRRMRLHADGFRFFGEDRRDGGAKLEIAWQSRWRRQIFQFAFNEAGVDRVGTHLRMRHQRREKRNVADDAANIRFLKPAIEPLDRGVAVWRPRDHLGQHGVVMRRYRIALAIPGVDTQAVRRLRHAPGAYPADRRHEILVRIFRVDSRFDGVTA